MTRLHWIKARPVPPAGGPPVAGYVAWWDASDTASITSSSGAVSQWNDKTGNGYHLAQSSATNKPTTGTRTLNSLNVLDFDGSNDGMDTSTWSSRSQPTTVFVVGALDNTTGNRTWFDTTSGRQNFYGRGSAWSLYSGSGEVFGGTANTSAHTFCAILNGASSQIYVDGTSIGLSGNPGTNAASGQFRVGTNMTSFNTYPLDGYIGEIIFYASALGTTDRNSVEAYLKAKWATP